MLVIACLKQLVTAGVTASQATKQRREVVRYQRGVATPAAENGTERT